MPIGARDGAIELGSEMTPPFVPDFAAEQARQHAPTSGRFEFRPFTLSDVGKLMDLAEPDRIGMTSIGVPPPCSTEFARMGYSSVGAGDDMQFHHWSVSKIGESPLIGYAGLAQMDRSRRQAELRVWVGGTREHADFAVEWSLAILQFALVRQELSRIYALQLARHPIAGQVLASVGMQRDGLLRKRLHREGRFEDVVCWSIQNTDWRFHGRA